MELNIFFRSVVDSDNAPIVICGLDHTIVYMNPEAVRRYAKRGGSALIGKSLLDCHNVDSCGKIEKVLEWFGSSENNNKVFTFHNEKENKDVYMVALRDPEQKLIGYYEKHESRTPDISKKYNIT